MERRTKLLLIILLGLLLLLLGLYFLLSPFLAQRQAQAPAGAKPATPLVTATGGKANTGGQPPTIGNAPVTAGTAPVNCDLRTLENRARSAVERIGSGTSGDGFLGYDDALLQLTDAGRAALLAEQAKLRQDHPAAGPTYGLSTRAISAKATEGAMGDASIMVQVQAIQRIDAGVPNQPVATQGKSVKVTFQKQADGSYLIDSLVWEDVKL